LATVLKRGERKKKYFLENYLDIVNTVHEKKNLKILPFTGRRIEVWWIFAVPFFMLLAKLRQ